MSPLSGNPINYATGNKSDEITDIPIQSGGLSFTRTYNSRGIAAHCAGQPLLAEFESKSGGSPKPAAR